MNDFYIKKRIVFIGKKLTIKTKQKEKNKLLNYIKNKKTYLQKLIVNAFFLKTRQHADYFHK